MLRVRYITEFQALTVAFSRFDFLKQWQFSRDISQRFMVNQTPIDDEKSIAIETLKVLWEVVSINSLKYYQF